MKRTPEFCARLRESSLEQSKGRSKRALAQWTKRKSEGFTNLKLT